MTVWNDARFTERLAHSYWMANVAVLMHLNERTTGDPAREWLGSWAHRYFTGPRVLVLGCGEGWLERSIAHWPFIEDIHAVDFAADAVARAAESARGIAKIRYGVVDLNRDELARDAYDVVIAHQVLHHVERLEHAFAQLDGALRNDGMFIVNEYAGPNRFQYDDAVDRAINVLARCIPPYEPKPRPRVEEIVAHDASEAVRSEELLPFVEERFEVLERKNLGGTILQHLLYGIGEHFRFEDPKERAAIELLCTIEAMLVDRGAIPSDFVILAARKRGSRAKPIDRALPPRPEAARDVDEDPLARGAMPARGASGSGLTAHHLRALRIALASTQARRANLFHESRFRAAVERFRCGRSDGWQWVRARYAAAHGEDAVIRALLEAAATLSVSSAVSS